MFFCIEVKRMPQKTVKKASKQSSSKKNAVKSAKTSKKAVRKAISKIKKGVALKPSFKPVAAKLATKGNLLVTFDPNHKGTAIQELKDNLKGIGEKFDMEQAGVEGLVKLSVTDPRKAVAKLTNMCRKDHTAFMVTHHYVPIDTWSKSEVEDIQHSIVNLLHKIKDNESWKLNLNKRHWDKMGGVELILKLTDVIDRKHVDLENPQKIIQVEIVGENAGISVLSPSEILDVLRLKVER